MLQLLRGSVIDTYFILPKDSIGVVYGRQLHEAAKARRADINRENIPVAYVLLSSYERIGCCVLKYKGWNNMKKLYQDPEIEVLKMIVEDILTSSGFTDDEYAGDEDEF